MLLLTDIKVVIWYDLGKGHILYDYRLYVYVYLGNLEESTKNSTHKCKYDLHIRYIHFYYIQNTLYVYCV